MYLLCENKNEFFDDESELGFSFRDEKDSPDVILTSQNKRAVIKNLNPRLVKTCVEKGFIMFYETNKKNEAYEKEVELVCEKLNELAKVHFE